MICTYKMVCPHRHIRKGIPIVPGRSLLDERGVKGTVATVRGYGVRRKKCPMGGTKQIKRGIPIEKPNKERDSNQLCDLNLQGCSSSPRAISIAQLNTLLCLHLRPINLVVYKCPYSLEGMGYLILRCASRLDAFSVYHIRTRLFCYALGRTTDAPEVRPTRSSRTKVSSSQISNAHDR